jgi:hypothetical protein
MPVEGINGILNVESAALHAPQVGVANTNPQHILSVGSNLYVSGDSTDVLTVDGNVVCEGVKVGLIEIIPSYDLAAVSNVGNSTSNTIQFTNATTAFVTTGNVSVGKDLNVTGNLNVLGTTTTIDTENLRVKDPIIELGKDNPGTGDLDLGLVMTRPSGSSNVAVIFDEDTDTLKIGYTEGSASDTNIIMDSAPLSVNINGDLSVTSNVEVGLANLFVDTVTGRVGIGTTAPTSQLNVASTLDPPSATDSATFDKYSVVITNTIAGDADDTEMGISFANFGGTTFPSNNRTPGAAITHERVDAWSKGKLHFKTKGNTNYNGACTTRMTIDETGNVGIGTNNPDYKLHIEDATNPRILLENTDPTLSENQDIGSILFKQNDTTNAGTGIIGKIRMSSVIGPYSSQFFGTSANMIFSVGNNPTDNANIDALTIRGDGNVGIGTTDPSSKLTVNQIPQHRASYDHSLAPMTITNRISTSNATLNDPKHVLNLAREGTSGEAYGARATFKLSRWENNYVNSRSRLDLDLAHDQYNEVTVMKWYSNGTVNLSSGNAVESDDRIKYNEEDIPNALETLNKLKPQKYEKLLFAPEKTGKWIPSDNDWDTLKLNDGYTWINEYGFIAQDVRAVPELAFLVHGEEMQIDTKTSTHEEYSNLTTDEQGTYTVSYIHESNVITQSDYSNLTPEEQGLYSTQYTKQIETQTPLALNYQGLFVVAIGAIKELKAKNDALETQLTSVLTRLDALENA